MATKKNGKTKMTKQAPAAKARASKPTKATKKTKQPMEKKLSRRVQMIRQLVVLQWLTPLPLEWKDVSRG